jgi:endonuclease G
MEALSGKDPSMIEIPSLRPESRYGIPTSDLLLFNRQYVVGYSYLFRQPRWAMQIIDEDTMDMEDDFDRLDNFREDLRIPEKFRSTLADYKGSGFDRGHLINSADRKGSKIINSETFLLSNMTPQKPRFNRDIWLELEKAVRVLAEKDEFAEVYTICGRRAGLQLWDRLRGEKSDSLKTKQGRMWSVR